MNYYAAREKMDENGKGMGVWHYTRENAGKIYRHPPCAGECAHSSPEEVYAHLREHRLDRMTITDDIPNAEHLDRCKADGCMNYTAGGVRFGGGTIQNVALCKKHRTREEAPNHVLLGSSYSSY